MASINYSQAFSALPLPEDANSKAYDKIWRERMRLHKQRAEEFREYDERMGLRSRSRAAGYVNNSNQKL